MLMSLAALIGAALAAYVLTPVVRRWAQRLCIIDRPDRGRKRHRRLVPLWGGLAVGPALALGVVIGLAGMPEGVRVLAYQGGWLAARLVWLTAGFFLLIAAGLIDDAHPLPPRVKLLTQLAAALLVVAAGFRIEQLPGPGGFRELVPVLGGLLAVAWLVFFMNAYNFIDGLDGLAVNHTMIAGLALAGAALGLGRHSQDLSVRYTEHIAAVIASAAAGAALGFWRFNRFPARIFLGEAGSAGFGFALGLTALMVASRPATPAAPWAVGLILGWPLADALSVIVRRLRRGEPISKADNHHLHHRLLHQGFSPTGAVAFIRAAALLLGFSGLALAWL